MHTTLVSVIIPVYNAEKYLKKCINSVLAQTMHDFELVLVDDGSKDTSLKICKEYEHFNNNIHVVHQENKGPSAARNTGIKNAKGKYIVFVDADDWVEPDYLEVLTKYMTEGGFVACALKKRKNQKIIKYTKEEAQCSVFSVYGMQGFSCCKIYDRNLIEKEKIYYDETVTICEDVLFAVFYLSKVFGTIYYLPNSPYHYEKTSEGITDSRYRNDYQFHEHALSEYDAIAKCKNYVVGKKAYYYQQMRSVKGAVNTLRVMTANRCGKREDKKRLRQLIRKNSYRYLFWEGGSLSTKCSVLLAAVSSKLEFWIWRKQYH